MPKVAARNVRIILENSKSNRLERRLPLLDWKLSVYIIDIAALSVTRLASKGQLIILKVAIFFSELAAAAIVDAKQALGLPSETVMSIG